MMSTEQLARAFVAAGAALGESLAENLVAQDPDLAAKLAYALEHGERMVLAVEFDPVLPMVRLTTVDDYGAVKRVMHIGAARGSIQ